MEHLRISALHTFVILFCSCVAEMDDYCDKKYCIGNRVHVRCNNDGEFATTCIGQPQLVDLRPYRQLILDTHNYYRNLIASGSLAPFDPAVRMTAITQWDDDLQINAQYNVKSCIFAHDQCRSTNKYIYAGQNIYTDRTTHLDSPVEDEIRQALYMWFAEHRYATKELLQHFQKTSPQTGHFTLLVNDRITALGCAFLDNFQPGTPLGVPRRFIIFTCDYASQNIFGHLSYKTGVAASKCIKIHPEYTSLCNDDAIDANDISWYYT